MKKITKILILVAVIILLSWGVFFVKTGTIFRITPRKVAAVSWYIQHLNRLVRDTGTAKVAHTDTGTETKIAIEGEEEEALYTEEPCTEESCEPCSSLEAIPEDSSEELLIEDSPLSEIQQFFFGKTASATVTRDWIPGFHNPAGSCIGLAVLQVAAIGGALDITDGTLLNPASVIQRANRIIDVVHFDAPPTRGDEIVIPRASLQSVALAIAVILNSPGNNVALMLPTDEANILRGTETREEIERDVNNWGLRLGAAVVMVRANLTGPGTFMPAGHAVVVWPRDGRLHIVDGGQLSWLSSQTGTNNNLLHYYSEEIGIGFDWQLQPISIVYNRYLFETQRLTRANRLRPLGYSPSPL